MVSNWHFADSVSAFALFARTPSLSFRANQSVPWQAAPSVTSFNYQTDCGKPGVLQPNHKWLLLAARQGDEHAKKNMTVLESKLTPEQIAEGQKRAREFKPR